MVVSPLPPPIEEFQAFLYKSIQNSNTFFLLFLFLELLCRYVEQKHSAAEKKNKLFFVLFFCCCCVFFCRFCF